MKIKERFFLIIVLFIPLNYLVLPAGTTYKYNFWTEQSEKQLAKVFSYNPQTIKFGEKYWLEINGKIYVFSCLLKFGTNSFVCLLIKPRQLTLSNVDSLAEKEVSKFFNNPNLFFRIASFQICKQNSSTYYNLIVTTNEGPLWASLRLFSGVLEARITQILHSFVNWCDFLLYFDLLNKDNLHCAVYIEYLVTNYVNEFGN